MNHVISRRLLSKIKGYFFNVYKKVRKRRLIEYFLSHENVIESLYLITFGNDLPRLGSKLTESWKF